MAAYFQAKLSHFLTCDPSHILGTLQDEYAADGYSSQYSKQTIAWSTLIPKLQEQLKQLRQLRPSVSEWTILFEYPLYRLRRRIDIVVLAGPVVIVIECKVGGKEFTAADRRQVEEYALDLRDFHLFSRNRRIVPILWSTAANAVNRPDTYATGFDLLDEVALIGSEGLIASLSALEFAAHTEHIVAEDWNQSPYAPVPGVIEAATHIFAGHDVRSIANADADNLGAASMRLLELITLAKKTNRRFLILVSGVPGAGKTLVGLNIVHDSVEAGIEPKGDIVYLSGNTPLVVVLREALARDEYSRSRQRPTTPNAENATRTLTNIRRDVRTRIQHINDFLNEGYKSNPDAPPHEHVIVFDEAQRAWDAKQGQERFKRMASEPELVLQLMGRHPDWCACICLIGGGQEINTGEDGVLGWGNALRKLTQKEQTEWSVFAPPHAFLGGSSTGSASLGLLPSTICATSEPALQLTVPLRSYRSPRVSEWLNAVLAGDMETAAEIAKDLEKYPIYVTRSVASAKQWLRSRGKGKRRYGLLASSGARRLRADGLGILLHASAGDEIAHWYLNEVGDIRSSFAMEVPANEYTCQGLELDFACICWGGDFLWDKRKKCWNHQSLSGNVWKQVKTAQRQRFIENSYRVLLTRAREGLIIWIPEGNDDDPTRPTGPMDQTATFLISCGAREFLSSI